jgi:hypothetical protein
MTHGRSITRQQLTRLRDEDEGCVYVDLVALGRGVAWALAIEAFVAAVILGCAWLQRHGGM